MSGFGALSHNNFIITYRLTPIYRRERRFFDICIPDMRLRNKGSSVGPVRLLQILINQGDGEGEARDYCELG